MCMGIIWGLRLTGQKYMELEQESCISLLMFSRNEDF